MINIPRASVRSSVVVSNTYSRIYTYVLLALIIPFNLKATKMKPMNQSIELKEFLHDILVLIYR